MMKHEPIEIVKCKHCGRATTMTGTKMCDGCWELDHRIKGQPDLAAKILTAQGSFRVIPAVPIEKRLYMIEVRLPSGTTIICETTTNDGFGTFDEAKRTTVISDLIKGQFDQPTRVFELVDASAEIAQAVADKLHSDGYPASNELRPFLERHGADEKVGS